MAVVGLLRRRDLAREAEFLWRQVGLHGLCDGRERHAMRYDLDKALVRGRRHAAVGRHAQVEARGLPESVHGSEDLERQLVLA